MCDTDLGMCGNLGINLRPRQATRRAIAMVYQGIPEKLIDLTCLNLAKSLLGGLDIGFTRSPKVTILASPERLSVES
jgi:hypothetical protein